VCHFQILPNKDLGWASYRARSRQVSQDFIGTPTPNANWSLFGEVKRKTHLRAFLRVKKSGGDSGAGMEQPGFIF
jgi:hypothetical protein